MTGRVEVIGNATLHLGDFRVWTADVLPGYGRGTEAWQRWQEEQMGEAA